MYYFSYSKKVQQGLAPGQAAPGAVPTVGGGQVSDPMIALRNLAGQGGTTQIQGHPGQPPLGTVMLGTTGGLGVAGQPQPQVLTMASQSGLVSSTTPNIMATALGHQGGPNPLVMQQSRFMGPVGTLGPQQQPPPQQSQQGQTAILGPAVQFHLQKLRAQQQQQQQAQTGPAPTAPGQQPSPVGAPFPPQVPQPSTISPLAGQSPVSVTVSSQSTPGNQSTVPSPIPQLPPAVSRIKQCVYLENSQPSPTCSSQMAPSPAGYAPSPSSQIVPSPVSGLMGRVTPGTMGAPSPSSSLNTPATVTTPSPAGRTSQDDQAYLEKLKQLSKFIEPLRRMISRIDKDEDRKKELSKMKNLLDILSDPNKRCPMETLLKCEQVLERMELKAKASESAMSSLPSSQPPIMLCKPQEHNICQPLLDAVVSNIKSPLFNHILYRSFGPVMAALTGHTPRVPSPPPKRKKLEEDIPDISDILQGEIARLDQRFKVQLDPVQHNGSRTVHLICQLDDKNLPCVPPISITVPENYPERPPQCDTRRDEYESTPFLQCIQKGLMIRLSKMPEKYSVTSLLDTWEMSVRQACTPPPILAAS